MTCKKEQIGILMKQSKMYCQTVAAAKAGMSLKTARTLSARESEAKADSLWQPAVPDVLAKPK